jgi:hypothetical protein
MLHSTGSPRTAPYSNVQYSTVNCTAFFYEGVTVTFSRTMMTLQFGSQLWFTNLPRKRNLPGQ